MYVKLTISRENFGPFLVLVLEIQLKFSRRFICPTLSYRAEHLASLEH
jgi:hypothetical protein